MTSYPWLMRLWTDAHSRLPRGTDAELVKERQARGTGIAVGRQRQTGQRCKVDRTCSSCSPMRWILGQIRIQVGGHHIIGAHGTGHLDFKDKESSRT